MRIAVCYKNVPDVESLRVNPDGTLNFTGIPWEIGPYDLNAVEAGVTLAESLPGSEVIALSVGGKEMDDTKLRKAILARGPDRLYGVRCEAASQADSFATASAIAEAVRSIGGVDLVLFGEGSGDIYAQQTGSMVGALLGWNCLNSVSALSADGDGLEAVRSLENGTERYHVALPAAISVTSDINTPRLASMKAILAAGKKPVEVVERETMEPNPTCVESIIAPRKAARRQQVFTKPDEDALALIRDTIAKSL